MHDFSLFRLLAAEPCKLIGVQIRFLDNQ